MAWVSQWAWWGRGVRVLFNSHQWATYYLPTDTIHTRSMSDHFEFLSLLHSVSASQTRIWWHYSCRNCCFENAPQIRVTRFLCVIQIKLLFLKEVGPANYKEQNLFTKNSTHRISIMMNRNCRVDLSNGDIVSGIRSRFDFDAFQKSFKLVANIASAFHRSMLNEVLETPLRRMPSFNPLTHKSTRSSPQWRSARSTNAHIVLNVRSLIWGFAQRKISRGVIHRRS